MRVSMHFCDIDNFGDQLNREVYKGLFEHVVHEQNRMAEVYGIGSILEDLLQRNNEDKDDKFTTRVFGSGFGHEAEDFTHDENIKSPETFISNVKCYALRGELTRKRVETIEGQSLGDIALGDPGLLVNEIIHTQHRPKKYKLGIAPHFADADSKKIKALLDATESSVILDPRKKPADFLSDLLECETVVSTALHPLIACDALGIPNLWIRVSEETTTRYKFADYYSVFGLNPTPILLTNENITKITPSLVRKSYKVKASDVSKVQKSLKAAMKRMGEDIAREKAPELFFQPKDNHVLLVEPNPYHGEIIPGYVKYFQDLGYNVDLLLRKEQKQENLFQHYPANKIPEIHYGTPEEIRFILSLPQIRNYVTIFFTTNVYWVYSENYSSYLRYLGFIPSGQHGSLYVEHNLSHLVDDDAEIYDLGGRVSTLLSYDDQANSKQTIMINPHYFGDNTLLSSSIKPKNKTRIVLVGASNHDPLLIDNLYRAINEVKDLNFEVLVTGGKIDIPKEYSRIVKTLPRLSFDAFSELIVGADFLLTMFNPHEPTHDRYLNGTTSGTVQLSLGFKTPMIVNSTHAEYYGFTSKESLSYPEFLSGDVLRRAITLPGVEYDSLVNSLELKAKFIYKESLSNLSSMLKQIKNKKKAQIELEDKATQLLIEKRSTITRQQDEIQALEDRINELEYEKQVGAIEVQGYVEKSQHLIDLLKSRKYKTADRLARDINLALPPESVQRKLLRAASQRVKNLKAYQDKFEHSKQKKLLETLDLFDIEYYTANNPDVAENNIDPLDHYLMYGYKEGRNPSALFDQHFYLAMYPDVRASGINPLVHYIKWGRSEGRQINLPIKEDLKDKRVNIALQLDSFDKGGLEEVVLTLANSPDINHRYKVHIFITGDGQGYMADMARSKGISVYALDNDETRLDYLVKKLNIKLCNLHYSIFGVDMYKNNNVKLLYTVHNNYIWADDQFTRQRKLAYAKIDRFVAVSDQVASYFVRKFGVPKKRVATVTNGIDLSSEEAAIVQKRSDYGIEEDDFVFINVASFTYNKFHSSAIVALSKVVKKYPNTKLLLVGNVISEDYFSNVKSLITKYKLEENVIICDYVPKQVVLGLLKMSNCFMMTSLTEGFSIAMIEAMYHRLPLLLTDVGGARHSIRNSDIGLIVNNAYDDILDLTDENIRENYTDDSNLANLDELVDAMENMVVNKKTWKARAQKGKKRVLTEFLSVHTIHKYIDEMGTQVRIPPEVRLGLENILDEAEIAFMAPYPTKARITEGWMSRINAIDNIIGNKAKIYLNISMDDNPLRVERHDPSGWELSIGRRSINYTEVMDLVVEAVGVVYVHTLHLAEYIVPWLETGKIIVDFHGITPEEEVMLGHAYLKEKYEEIEQAVLQNARLCVMVTNSMHNHYVRKYPDVKASKVILLPIVEEISRSKKTAINKQLNSKYEIVYSGGTQPWQNVNAMMQIAKNCNSFSRVTFLSHDWAKLKDLGEQLEVPADTRYEFCKKDNLYDRYAAFDYGLVLRDDTPVNKVACPTKLYEYMSCGIIPIVRLEHMGDFVELGYAYIKEEDYLTGRLPSEAEAKAMLKRNYAAVKQMQNTFANGRNKLKKEVA